MSDLKVKINLMADTTISRKSEIKSLKQAGEYDPRVIEVLGLPFGGHIEGRDSYGEAFTDGTGIGMRVGDNVPVTYYHGFTDDGGYQDPPALIGTATLARSDERGHWFDVQLDASEPYTARIFTALENGGDVKASSGAVGHLVRYGDAGLITTWVVGELALFDTDEYRQPANQYAVVGFKTAETEAQSETLKGEEPKSVKSADADADKLQNESKTSEENKMTDQVENTEVKAEAVDYGKIGEMIKDAIADVAPAKNAGLPNVGETVGKEDKVKAYKQHFDGFLHGKSNYKALQEGTDNEGGYWVPTEYSNEFVTGLSEGSLFDRARQIQMVSDTLKVPGLTNSTKAILTAEEASYSVVDPVATEVTFTAYKYTKLVKVADELIADSRIPVWNVALLPDFVQAFNKSRNEAFTTGTGSSQPQGAVTGAGTGVTAAGVAAVTADELIALYHSLGYLYRDNAVWMMNDSTIEAIRKLKDSNNNYLLSRLSDGQPQTLLGKPIITNNYMEAMATGKKTILFADLSYYWIGEREGLSMKRLNELYAANGQVGFRGFNRFDGHVMLADAFKVLVQA